MTAFVLVHGSGQNAASWLRVGDLLRARGHEVAAPELPKQAADWGVLDYGAAIAAAVTTSDTIVAAHSLSGAFLPLVPQLRSCRRLVYVAAVIPALGQSVREQFAADPSMFNPDWIAAGKAWLDPAEREQLARDFLFHDCDEATLEWGLTTLEPIETQRVVVDPCPLAEWPPVPSSSIVAARDRTLTPDWCRRRGRKALGEDAIEVDAGHCPHMTRPGEIADILLRLADAEESR